jgi:cytochrome b
MNKKPGYVFVWPISTRVIHWLMALSFSAAFYTSFYEHMLHKHVAFGFIFVTIIFYRIIWGFIGPKYATFNTFKLKPSELKYYFVEKVQNRWRKIPAGHNPASSWYTVWAMLVGTVIVVSGLLLYGVQEAKGPFMHLNDEYSQYMFILLAIHKYSSYLFAFWVFLHISGVMIEQFWHKTGMVWAMVTGYKKTEGEDTTVKKKLSIFAFIIIFIAVGTYFFIISSNYNFLTQRKYTNEYYDEENYAFNDKCGGECHKTYPPFFLPEKSWKRIIDDMDNHFGEEITEANISKSQQASIREFLYEHAADHSTKEPAVKVMKSLGKRRPKAITKTPYWRETHKNIPRSAYKDKKIKDKSNCWNCHKDMEYGNFDDMNILYRYGKGVVAR